MSVGKRDRTQLTAKTKIVMSFLYETAEWEGFFCFSYDWYTEVEMWSKALFGGFPCAVTAISHLCAALYCMLAVTFTARDSVGQTTSCVTVLK